MTKQTKHVLVHQPKRRPSLRDLAEKIGVSHTAVARALRNDPGLSDDLRKRVHRVAREEGYLFSDVTQGLITGWTGTIGVIVPRLVSPFISPLVAGISDALWQDRTIPLVLCSELDPKREEQMLETLATKRASGLIIMPCRADRHKDHFVHLIKQHTPIVALDNRMPNVQAPLVASNDDRGGELVTRHLLERGHRHIIHLGASEDLGRVDQQREYAYERVMREAGLQPRVVRLPHRRLLAEDIMNTLREWFSTTEGAKTTAVFAFNDSSAVSVYTFARERGMRIGRDLAVVGYGNARSVVSGPELFDLISPTMSSVEQHPNQWGTTAVDILRRMVAGEPVEQETLIEPELIVRESSG